MKYLLPGVGGMLAAFYLIFQAFNLGAIWEMWSSKYECDQAVIHAGKQVYTVNGSLAMKQAEAG